MAVKSRAQQAALDEQAMRIRHLEETVEMFRDDQDQKKLAIELDIPDDLPAVYADHDKLHQVFTNLISNAIKFSNQGGTVIISTRWPP